MIYCGVHDAVEVAALDWQVAVNGEPIDVPDDVALDLLEQAENWSKAPTAVETAAERKAREKYEAEEKAAAAVAGSGS